MKNILRFAVHLATVAIMALVVHFPATAQAESASGNFSAALEDLLNNSSNRTAENFPAPLKRFYSEHGYQPLWLTQSKPNHRAVALQNVVAKAMDEGLDPQRYAVSSKHNERPESLELEFSETFLRYVTDLQAGRVAPRRVDPELFLFERQIDHIGILTGLIRARDVETYLHDLAPQSVGYIKLREALAYYKSVADRGGLNPVPDGPTLKPGMVDRRVEQLRDHFELSRAGKVKQVDRSIYDPELIDAVRGFQSRMGLESDGVIGKQTLSALNIPVRNRIQQIILNMERARWMPDDFGEDYILINVPSFELKAVSQRKTALEMRVIIGKPYRRTPVFSQKLSHLEFNPTWTVPPQIAVLDLIPKLRENPGYFADEGIVVYDGWGKGSRPVEISGKDWTKYTIRNFPFRLQQVPGPKNALGRVKFMLPNQFSVYLHDTPTKELFGSASRAFSSGCIRVEKPMELAEFVLRDQPEWSHSHIERVLGEDRTRVVRIRRPIMVHFAYSTAWVDEMGQIHFRNDIYGRDKRLAAALGLKL